MTSDISPDDVIAALKRLKRGKGNGLDVVSNTFYRDYADTLGPIIATIYTRWLTCSVFPVSLVTIKYLKKYWASALTLDHRPFALLNSDYNY